MSHAVTCSVKFVKPEAIDRALVYFPEIKDLGIQTHKVYTASVEGRGLRLKDWKFPLVVNEEGSVTYDNYGGEWGKQEHLDDFTQRYALEAAKLEAEQHGWMYTETAIDNGNINLLVECA